MKLFEQTPYEATWTDASGAARRQMFDGEQGRAGAIRALSSAAAYGLASQAQLVDRETGELIWSTDQLTEHITAATIEGTPR